tara:strand:- start:319 stop:3141 length:2823 start_codon:yes stop_codon:yes gene_type:complete
MANFNLTSQQIKDSFNQLAQVSGSVRPTTAGMTSGSTIYDGTGSLVESLYVKTETSVSASHSLIADSATSATTALTASFFGEGIVTASAVAQTITFTKDNGSTFDVTVAQSGSVESSSYAAFASNAESASYAVSASSAIYTVSSSYAIKATSADTATSATTATSASHALQADNATSAVSSSHAVQADSSLEANDLVITVKNVQGVTIVKGAAVHGSGVTGENINVTTASNATDVLMPAIGIAAANINAGAAGEVIIAGRVSGFSTAGLVAGDSVFVSTGGGLTSVQPSGSNLIQNIGTAAKVDGTDGEIIVQGAGRTNALPNIANNHVWVGDSDSVPQATAVAGLNVLSAFSATSASFAISASSALYSVSASSAINAQTASSVGTLNQNLIVNGAISASAISSSGNITGNVVGNLTGNVTANSGTSNFTNISVSGTGSFGYIQSVTGSAKIIGDAFIVLNNDTPVEKFAGIKVIDSGSTNTTASLIWDGGTNDWKYEYSASAGHEAAVVIMGPEGSDINSTPYLGLNTVPKSNGGHHLDDSKITDDGTTVGISTKLKVTGSIEAVTSLTGSNLSILNTGSFGNVNVVGALKASGSYNQLIQNAAGVNNPSEVRTLEYGLSTSQTGESYDATFIGMHNYGSYKYDKALTMWKAQSDAFGYWSSVFSSGRGGGVELKTVSGSFGQLNVNTRSGTGVADALIQADQINIQARESIYLGNLTGGNNLATTYVGGPNVNNFKLVANSTSSIEVKAGLTVDYTLNVDDATTLAGTTISGLLATGIVSSSNIHASEVYVTSSLVSEGTTTLNSTTISGSLTVDGGLDQAFITSASVQSQIISMSIPATLTASLAPIEGNMFELELKSGSAVEISAPVSTPAGQTYILKTQQPSGSFGTITWDGKFKFGGGTAPAATEASEAIDIYTFVKYSNDDFIFSTAVSNLTRE